VKIRPPVLSRDSLRTALSALGLMISPCRKMHTQPPHPTLESSIRHGIFEGSACAGILYNSSSQDASAIDVPRLLGIPKPCCAISRRKYGVGLRML